MKEPKELAGEGVFTFPTAGGRVRLSMSEDALTPFGGLVPWAAFIKHVGVVEKPAEDCPVKRTSPNAAPVYDVIQSFMLAEPAGVAEPRRPRAGPRRGDGLARAGG